MERFSVRAIKTFFIVLFCTSFLPVNSQETPLTPTPSFDIPPFQEVLSWEAGEDLGENIYWSEVKWSPDGTRIAALSGFDLYIWDANDGSLLSVLEELTPRAFDWSPDSTQFVTVSIYPMISLNFWDATTGEFVDTIEGISNETDYLGNTVDVAWSSANDYIVSTGNFLLLWNLETRKPPTILTGFVGAGYAVEWDRSGNRLVSSAMGPDSVEGGMPPYTVTVWGVKTHESVEMLLAFSGSRLATISPNGQQVASLSRGLQIWDTLSDQLFIEKSFPMSNISAIEWQPTGQLIAIADTDGDIQLHDAKTGVELQDIRASEDAIRLSWNPEGTAFVSASDDRITIWKQ
jgi:WD40 repeat protein